MAIAFLAAFIGGAVVARWIYTPIVRDAQADARQATDRLVAAWQNGAQIPPREEPVVQHVVEALPPEVEEYNGQFDEAGRAVYDTKARSMMAEGLKPHEIVRRLDLMRFKRADGFAT